MFYVVMAIPFVAGALSEEFRPFVEWPYQQLDRHVFSKVEMLKQEGPDPLVASSELQFYGRGLLRVFLFAHCGACLMLSAICFAVGQFDGAFANSLAEEGKTTLSFFDALYFTVITSSTVGFGDVCPATGGARIFTMIAASFGLAIVSLFINQVTEMREDRKNYLKKSIVSCTHRSRQTTLRCAADISANAQCNIDVCSTTIAAGIVRSRDDFEA